MSRVTTRMYARVIGNGGALSNWNGSNWIRRERRYALYLRDGHRCLWCGGTRSLTLDHLFPRQGGRGDNRNENLVTSCLSCNSSRRHLRLSRWLRRLRDQAVDVHAIVVELRRRRRTLVDLEAGRALLTDTHARAQSRACATTFRHTILPELEAPCPF